MPSIFSYKKDQNNFLHLTLLAPKKRPKPYCLFFIDEFRKIVKKIEADKDVQVVFLTCEDEQFSLSYDLINLQKIKSQEDISEISEKMKQVLFEFSELKIATVFLIHGSCISFSLELALSCRWRIACNEASTVFGFPEIKYGLIPCAGGTQRLPRVIGLQAGLDMILTGRLISANKAQKNGLIDACVPYNMLYSQAKILGLSTKSKKNNQNSSNTSRISKELPKWAIEGNPIGRKVMLKKAKEIIDEKTLGFYPASYKALNVVFEGHDLELEQGSKLESLAFGELFFTKECSSLSHLHFAEELSKEDLLSKLKKKIKIDLKRVGVIGAGLMGSGISTHAANLNIKTYLSDPSKVAIGKAFKFARNYLMKKVDRRRLQTFEMQQKLTYISPSLGLEGFQELDVVIETVPEDLKLKQNILLELEKKSSKQWVFASNTSSLSLTEVASVAKKPERVVGMHFFAPVEDKPLVEITRGEKTAAWAVEKILFLSQKLGKYSIIVKDSPGHFSTRLQTIYISEALKILSEGTPAEFIDNALKQVGFKIGPIALLDMVGIEIIHQRCERLKLFYPDKIFDSPVLKNILKSGRQGQKNSKGFYLYENGEIKNSDTEAFSLLQTKASRKNPLKAQEIIERCLMIFINESVLCLEEKVLEKASDGDLAAIHGLGFPPFLGGPFKYCDFSGAYKVVEVLNGLSDEFGQRFKPAQLLKINAIENQMFFPEESG